MLKEPPAPIQTNTYQLIDALIGAARRQVIRQERRLAAKKRIEHELYGIEFRAKLHA